MSEIWKKRSCEVLLDRPPWFEDSVEEVELPGGKIVSDYHQIHMPHFTAVFAVTQNHNIMVMRCYRHAVGEVTLTMPGGMLEAGGRLDVGLRDDRPVGLLEPEPSLEGRLDVGVRLELVLEVDSREVEILVDVVLAVDQIVSRGVYRRSVQIVDRRRNVVR